MKDPQAANLVRLIKNFIKTFDDRARDPDRDSEMVQASSAAFLAKSDSAFRDHPVWANAPTEHQSQATEGLEKYLMTKIHGKVFAQSALDRERDEALGQRMAVLSFVRPEHLDIPAVYQDEKAWLMAMKELHKINNYKAPRDKLVCILNCCRVVTNLLQAASQRGSGAVGADDFLPVLIYVVIHANPPQLASNLEYITRFRMQSRMVSEAAYFFTQLYSAASFVETINSASLSMDPDEFVARMISAGVADIEVASQAASPRAQVGAETLRFSAWSEAIWAAEHNGDASPSPSVGCPCMQASLPVPWPSVADLQQAGTAALLQADTAGSLQQRHPYLYAWPGDLRVGDVARLLELYKELVLRHEAL
eukprot:jgi/Astpho2/4098/gw1.00063.257.1_t